MSLAWRLSQFSCKLDKRDEGGERKGATGVGHLGELERQSAESRVKFAHFPERNMFSRTQCEAGARREYE